MDTRRVVVTGVGAVTPVGNTVKDMWDSLLAGKSGTALVTKIDVTNINSKVAGELKGFDPTNYMLYKEARKRDEFVQYGIAAAQMASEDAKFNIEDEDPYRVGVIVGSGIGGLRVMEDQHNVILKKGALRISPFTIPMLICNMASGIIAIDRGCKGPNTCVVTACASGTHSIGDAFRILQRGDTDVMFAGGTEGCITELGLGGFAAMRALSTRNDEPEKASRPFDKTRDGFVMAEGAGIVILEELEHALKRNAKIYCEIVGYGATCDAYHVTAPNSTGEGAARCMSNAIADAGLEPGDISYVNAHGTSTPLNDAIETRAIKTALGEDAARKVAISSTKSMTGHLLGAAGAVEAVISALAIQNDIVPPTINYSTPDPDCDLDYVPNEARKMTVNSVISNSLGFGGHNVSLVVRKFKD